MTYQNDRLSTPSRFNQDFDFPWEHAFDKHGFDDGDLGWLTDEVADRLREHGYTVETLQWGLHNEIIRSIDKNGVAFMPVDDPTIAIGYTDPRDYLPAEIVALLDDAF